ncbi:GNAT family N-acetyltransferase [Patescibacteria group bacterium]|nr:GNAT family N-acetyltransferase [Patescibacteria group bacterium]
MKIKIFKHNPLFKNKLLLIFKQYPEIFFDGDLKTIKRRLGQVFEPIYPKFYAEIDGQPVGFISYFKRDSSEIWFLSWFAVDKFWQNQGIGKKLMAYVEKQIAKSPISRICIETVWADNEVVRKTNAFYEKCGYQRVGLIPDYYGKQGSKAFYYKDLGTVKLSKKDK